MIGTCVHMFPYSGGQPSLATLVIVLFFDQRMGRAKEIDEEFGFLHKHIFGFRTCHPSVSPKKQPRKCSLRLCHIPSTDFLLSLVAKWSLNGAGHHSAESRCSAVLRGKHGI